MPRYQSKRNSNSMSEPHDSGVSFSFRLSETLIAVLLGSLASGYVSFAFGFAKATSQSHSQATAKQVINCPVQELKLSTPLKH